MADGKGCKCAAHSESECGCDADWTPQEVYDLRAENDRLKTAIRRLANEDATLSLLCKMDGGNEVTVQMDAAEWIPVSERLPEEDIDVLAIEEDGGMLVVRLYHGRWGHSFGSGGPTDGRAWPTHWMPLPAIPEVQ